MAIYEYLYELSATLNKNQRILGLDLGSKTIGLALSDTLLTTATAYETIRRKKFTLDVEYLNKIIKTQNIGALIIGLPLNMDGSKGPRVQSTYAFVRNYLALHDTPIGFWDERLSTAAVTHTLLDADMSRQKRAKVVDKLAASFILQGALDYLQNYKLNH